MLIPGKRADGLRSVAANNTIESLAAWLVAAGEIGFGEPSASGNSWRFPESYLASFGLLDDGVGCSLLVGPAEERVFRHATGVGFLHGELYVRFGKMAVFVIPVLEDLSRLAVMRIRKSYRPYAEIAQLPVHPEQEICCREWVGSPRVAFFLSPENILYNGLHTD